MIPVAAGRPAVAVRACMAWLTAWALMGSLCTTAHATPHGETNTRYLLRTAAEQGGAPKWLQHGPQMHSGFCADVIAALNQRGSGLKIQLVEQALPQKRLLQQVKSGELDLLCALTHTEERDQDFVFVQPELYNMPYVLLARADDPVEVRSWEALRALGEQGLVLLNYDSSRLPLLKAKGGLHLHARGLTTEANLRMLLAGRGRFFYFPLSNA